MKVLPFSEAAESCMLPVLEERPDRPRVQTLHGRWKLGLESPWVRRSGREGEWGCT